MSHDSAGRLGSREVGEGSHPTRMNQKELKELIEFLIEKDIAEFELERGDVKVRIKRAGEHTVRPLSGRAALLCGASRPRRRRPSWVPCPWQPPQLHQRQQPPAPEEGLHMVKSPIVGTFYEAPRRALLRS